MHQKLAVIHTITLFKSMRLKYKTLGRHIGKSFVLIIVQVNYVVGALTLNCLILLQHRGSMTKQAK